MTPKEEQAYRKELAMLMASHPDFMKKTTRDVRAYLDTLMDFVSFPYEHNDSDKTT